MDARDVKCNAFKKDSQRCTNKAKSNGLCGVHSKQSAPVSKSGSHRSRPVPIRIKPRLTTRDPAKEVEKIRDTEVVLIPDLLRWKDVEEMLGFELSEKQRKCLVHGFRERTDMRYAVKYYAEKYLKKIDLYPADRSDGNPVDPLGSDNVVDVAGTDRPNE